MEDRMNDLNLMDAPRGRVVESFDGEPTPRVMTNGNLNREKLPWTQDLWDRIDMAVHDEMKRILIARRFIPVVTATSETLTVAADTVVVNPGTTEPMNKGLLQVNEAAVTEMLEVWVEFSLTKQQVEREAKLWTAVHLAIQAANLLAQGEDLIINQGRDVLQFNALFLGGRIHTRAGPGPIGLANRKSLPNNGDPDPQIGYQGQVIPVNFTNPNEPDRAKKTYGENTFGAVGDAYARLQGQGHYGPYALMLAPKPNADTRRPLKKTRIMPADRIISLVDGKFYGTGTLPEIPELLGVMLSWGGNAIDLVIGRDATTAFLQEDTQGLYRFRVFERFALRDKNPSSRFLLKFDKP
jgi:uncharacterized linocin/CFP29 family protein